MRPRRKYPNEKPQNEKQQGGAITVWEHNAPSS